jgi:hypothetical protein
MISEDFGRNEKDWADMLEALTTLARGVTLGDGQTVTVDVPMDQARN